MPLCLGSSDNITLFISLVLIVNIKINTALSLRLYSKTDAMLLYYVYQVINEALCTNLECLNDIKTR